MRKRTVQSQGICTQCHTGAPSQWWRQERLSPQFCTALPPASLFCLTETWCRDKIHQVKHLIHGPVHSNAWNQAATVDIIMTKCEKPWEASSSKKMTEVWIYSAVCSKGKSFTPLLNLNKAVALLINMFLSLASHEKSSYWAGIHVNNADSQEFGAVPTLARHLSTLWFLEG